jgi:hypothetical protein
VLGVGVLRWPLLGALFGLGLPAGWWAWRALGPAARPTEGKQGAGS